MLNRSYTSAKSGMENVDKKRVIEIVESMSTSEYQKYTEKKQADLNTKLTRMREKLASMTEQDKLKYSNKADEIVCAYEEQRDLTQTYVHIDMDSYFASVEMRDNPKLRNVPMAVGSRQMISTSNYEARKYGVRSAMPGYIAEKLCPQLVFVPCNFEKYIEAAKVYRNIFSQYDPDFHFIGLDEATLNLTNYRRAEFVTYSGKYFGGECDCFLPVWNQELSVKYPDVRAEKVKCETCDKERIIFNCEVTFPSDDIESVVSEIRWRVEQETRGLTCSAGIAPNFMLAKICSEQRKPNNQFRLNAEKSAILDFVYALKVRSIPGIGPSMESLLNGLGIETCKDVIDRRRDICYLFTKNQSNFLLRSCSGISSVEIECDDSEDNVSKHSISNERTFSATDDRKFLNEMLHSLTNLVYETIKERGYIGCSKITVKIKFSTFKETSKTQSLIEPVIVAENAFKIAKILLDKILGSDKTKVRLLGISLSDFADYGSKPSTSMDKFAVSSNQVEDDEIEYIGIVRPKKKPKRTKPVKAQKSISSFVIRHKLTDLDDDDIQCISPKISKNK